MNGFLPFTCGTAEYPVLFAGLLFGYFSLVKDLNVVKPNTPDGVLKKHMGFISHVHLLGLGTAGRGV